jgi:hypothetical protein
VTTYHPSKPDAFGFGVRDVETVGPDGTTVIADPASADDGAVEDHRAVELLEVLLCFSCGMELSAPPCGAKHAYLADNPMEHRLLAPILEKYLHAVRRDEGRVCVVCTPNPEGTQVLIATGDCPHITVHGDQVSLSRAEYNRVNEELSEVLRDVARMEDQLIETQRKLSIKAGLLRSAVEEGDALEEKLLELQNRVLAEAGD